MENIRIHDKNYDIVLYLDKNKFFGYKFNKDNTIEKIDKNVFKYFDFFTCSNDFSVLPIEGEYNVVLDNDTNFKHYFKGGSEDYNMFFKNNGTLLINYKNDKLLESINSGLTTAFLLGSATIFISMSAYHLVELYTNNVINSSKQEVVIERKEIDNYLSYNEQEEDKIIASVVNDDLTYDKIKELIYSSNNLNQEEKELLDNEDLINDVVNTVSDNNIVKYDLLKSFKDIDIKSYTDEQETSKGYYEPSSYNIINVKNYNGLNKDIKETITHEYIHLLQYHYREYNLITEACAEIVSAEYYDDININSYYQQVSLIKKLMEIIGPDPVWKYTFTGDFSLIEENVKPYLDDEQYKTFLNCLQYLYGNNNDNIIKFDKLNSLLNILYENRFNQKEKDDLIMSLLDNNDKSLKRYYFNKKYINQDNSYYEDGNNVITISMTIPQAVLNDYVYVEESIKEYITSDQVYDYLKTHNNKGLTRHCVYIDGFKETAAAYMDDGIKISGYLNGEFLSNIPESELIEKGIVKSVEYYYIKDIKRLSTEQFLNNEYDLNSKLDYYPNPDKSYLIKFNEEGDFDIYIGTKTNLPTIYDKFNKDKVR